MKMHSLKECYILSSSPLLSSPLFSSPLSTAHPRRRPPFFAPASLRQFASSFSASDLRNYKPCCKPGMAHVLGQLALLGGAALIGSVVVEKGRLPTVTESLTGAFKVLRTLGGGEFGTSKSKSDDASVTQGINVLRHQLQVLESNRSIVVVSSNNGSGSSKYSVIIVVVVVGYGYVWWKGWKLSDMMFATKRSLADACGNVSKQLENVYQGIDKTKRQLTARIDSANGKIDEYADNNTATKDEVSKLRGDLDLMGTNTKSVRDTIQTLETKLISLEGRQGETLSNIGKLVNTVRNIEIKSKPFEPIEGVSRTSSVPALENSEVAPARALSLPPTSPMGPSTPSPENGASQVRTTVSNGLKIVELSNQSSAPPSSNTPPANESSGSGIFGWSTPRTASMVTRSFSLTNFKSKLSSNIQG